MAFKGKVSEDEITDVDISTLGKPTPAETGSLLDQLRAQPDEEEFENATPWIPDVPGDGIEGTVIGITQYHVEDFGQDKILRVIIVRDSSDREWSVIPFHRNLRSQLAKHRPDVGDQLAILYVNEEPSTTDPDKYMKKYRVARKSAARVRRSAASAEGNGNGRSITSELLG